MADMTLIQAIAFLEGLPKKIGEKGVEVMKEEFNHKDRPYATGATEKSFHYEIAGDIIFIGASTPGAKWVEQGRGAVRPKRARYLAWENGPKGSGAELIFAKYSRPVKADKYIERTARRLESMDFH